MPRREAIGRSRARIAATLPKQPREAGAPLPTALRREFERHFDHDFGNVRVHATPGAARVAEDLGAKAFTVRDDIFFGAGRFAPETPEGERLLAHELTHVVQQSRRRGPPFLQCDDLADVAKVRSLVVEEKEAEEKAAQLQLQKRLAKRRKDIEQLLKETKDAGRKAALQTDLAKSTEEIVDNPDSKGVSAALRKDIAESYRLTKKSTKTREAASTAFHKYDKTFADKDVVKTLATINLKPADLKALIARESGDLTEDDQSGDIAGIAQIGTKEEKRAGGAAGDRKIPEKAIPLAAKVLVDTAGDLKKQLKALPAGIEWKKFLFAAYNAGVWTIETAQDNAIAKKLSGTVWSEIVAGAEKSPLFAACQKWYKTKAAKKYSEVVNHINGIFARLKP